MVAITEAVWSAWRETTERVPDEPAMLLLFSPAGDHGDVPGALRESLLKVQDSYPAGAEGSGDADPPFAGEWDWVRVSDGLLVQVVECDALEEVLPAVAAALERRGIEGAFHVRARPY